jgi:hypothetical protein
MTGKTSFTLTILGLAALGWLLTYPVQTQAQTEGNDAVYNASNGVTFSSSFIDASQFLGHNQGVDLCDTIYGILVNKWGVAAYPSSGAVVDARGISSALTCTLGSPWTEGSNTATLPSTILLPAGTIQISTPWVLPSNTRLIGEGESDPRSAVPGTTIQAASQIQLQAMIQFGSSAVCSSGCSGISVERLTIDGNSLFLHGISNLYAQNNTYVDHVMLYQILGTGLLISGPSAQNSGPYTNITFDTGSTPVTTSTACAQIIGTGGTKGIRGLMCKSETNDASAAVLLEALESPRHVDELSLGTSLESVTSEQPRPSGAWTGHPLE